MDFFFFFWLRKRAVFLARVSAVVHGMEGAMGSPQEALMSIAAGVKSFELDSGCLLCLALGHPRIQDFILEVVTYGPGCF